VTENAAAFRDRKPLHEVEISRHGIDVEGGDVRGRRAGAMTGIVEDHRRNAMQA
jgi:hypothetical protein